MPRYASMEAPHAVHHLVSRFVNEEFRITNEFERRGYLERVPGALKRSDWSPLSLVIMSNHNHWGMLAGTQPSASFIKPLHVGYAGWLNKLQQRRGPLFAERHRSIVCDEEHAANVIAYIHNNPVRAGLVADPVESSWSTHRVYLGLEEAPEWLDVARGLSICGFNSSPSGRLAFHDFVVSRSRHPRSEELSGGGIARQRARIRALLSAAIECSWPAVGQTTHRDVVIPRSQTVLLPWPGDPLLVMGLVADRLGFSISDLVLSRRHDAAGARRMVLHLWTRHLGRKQSEIRFALGMSSSAASELLRTPRVSWEKIDEACSLLAAELRRNNEIPRSVPIG